MKTLYSYTPSPAGSTWAYTGLQPRAFQFTATDSGTIDQVKLSSITAGRNFKLNIWSHDSANNRPLNKIASSAELVSSVGVMTIAIIEKPAAASGTIYWLSMVGETSAVGFLAGDSTSSRRSTAVSISAYSDPVPSPWNQSASGNTAFTPYLVVESLGESITSITDLKTGQAATVTYSGSFAGNSATITDGDVSKTVSVTPATANSGTLVMPAWSDEETALKVGDVSITVTDGTATTPAFIKAFEFWSDHPDNPEIVQFTPIEITSLGDGHIGQGFLKIGMQVTHDAARFELGSDGVLNSILGAEYVGVSRLWLRDPDDFVSEWLDVDTTEGAVAPVMPADRTVTVYEGATTLGTFPAASGTPPISYEIGGDDAALFTISSATAKVDPVGALTIGQSGVITVTPENSAGAGAPQTINWSVIAVPEPSPDDYQRFPKGSTLKGSFIKVQTLKGKYL